MLNRSDEIHTKGKLSLSLSLQMYVYEYDIIYILV